MSQSKSVKFFSLGLALLLACSTSKPAQVARPMSPSAAKSPEVSQAARTESVVDASSLHGGLARLPVDEQVEQIADWAVAGALAEVLRQQPEALDAVGRLPPLRRDARYQVLGIHDYGRARRLIVDANQVLLVLPADEPEPDQVLAGLADLARTDLGRIPDHFLVYRYTHDASAGRIALSAGPRLAGAELFSPAFGYVESTISNEADLARWLKQVESLAYFTLKEGRMVLGGRAGGRNSANRIQLEDVAALYQAQLAAQPHLPPLHRLLRDRERLTAALTRLGDVAKANVARYNQGSDPDCQAFDEAWRALGRVFGDGKAIGPVSCTASATEIMTAEAAVMKALVPWASEVLQAHDAEMNRLTASAPRTSGLGFSLDPQWEVSALERDVAQLKKDPQPILADAQALAAKAGTKVARGANYPTQTAAFLVDTLQRARIRSLAPLTGQTAAILDNVVAEARGHGTRTVERLVIFERLLAHLGQSREPEAQVLGALLRFVEARDRIQCARYDGALAGTRVGMQLFYTDLQAKLWAGLDYQGSAPKQAIPGMPTLWSTEGGGEHSTRLWFGPRADRMARQSDFTTMVFAPVATHIYSASSVALEPGREETPPDPVRRTLDFWTHHYPELARHDGRFAFVNEVQKWSALTDLWAKWDAMPELERRRFDRRQVFDRWATREPGVHLPQGIGLLPKARWVSRDPSWECMEQLAASKDEGEQHWTISGGHSLADFASPRPLPAPAEISLAMHAPAPGTARTGKRVDRSRVWDHTSSAAIAGNHKTKQHAAHDATTSRDGNVVTTIHKAPDGSGDVSRFELTDSGTSLSAPSLDNASAYGRAHDQLMEAESTKAMKMSAQAKVAQPDSRKIRLRSHGHDQRGEGEPPGPVLLAYQSSWRDQFHQMRQQERTNPSPSRFPPDRPSPGTSPRKTPSPSPR